MGSCSVFVFISILIISCLFLNNASLILIGNRMNALLLLKVAHSVLTDKNPLV